MFFLFPNSIAGRKGVSLPIVHAYYLALLIAYLDLAVFLSVQL